MSNVIPFPSQTTKSAKTPDQYANTPMPWTAGKNTITFDDIDVTIEFTQYDASSLLKRTPDYANHLMLDIQACMDRDPGIVQYVCENLERLLKTVKR